METQTLEPSRELYAERDLMPISGNVPELGVESGYEGIIKKLSYQKDQVYASVLVTYPRVARLGPHRFEPESKVLSYTTV